MSHEWRRGVPSHLAVRALVGIQLVVGVPLPNQGLVRLLPDKGLKTRLYKPPLCLIRQGAVKTPLFGCIYRPPWIRLIFGTAMPIGVTCIPELQLQGTVLPSLDKYLQII